MLFSSHSEATMLPRCSAPVLWLRRPQQQQQHLLVAAPAIAPLRLLLLMLLLAAAALGGASAQAEQQDAAAATTTCYRSLSRADFPHCQQLGPGFALHWRVDGLQPPQQVGPQAGPQAGAQQPAAAAASDGGGSNSAAESAAPAAAPSGTITLGLDVDTGGGAVRDACLYEHLGGGAVVGGAAV